MGYDEEASYRLSTSVGYQLGLTARLHERRLETRLSDAGISRTDFTVLCAIGSEGCSTPSSVADFLQVEKSAVSRILRELRALDLVLEGASSTDKRVKVLGLTVKGKGVLAEGIKAVTTERARIRAVLSPREVEVLTELLQKIRAIDSGRRAHL